MLFSSGRPYAALLDVANAGGGGVSGDAVSAISRVHPFDSGGSGGSNTVNDSAALQPTPRR